MARGGMGETLRSAIRFLVAGIGLWLMLTTAPAPAFSGESVAGMCSTPVNLCGCVSCGCGEPRQPSCPAGSSLYDDYCLPDCPAGYLRYPGYPGLCMPPCTHGCPEGFEQVPLPYCPEGYHRDLGNPDYCVPDDTSWPGDDNCPAGWSYSHETGRCELDCPQGYVRGANGLCEWVYDRECRQGFTRDPESGKCLPPGVWPPGYRWICLPNCPPGTYRDIYHPTRCLPPPPQCPEGFESYNGRCAPICEQGTERDPYGYCVPERCPDGTYPNLRGQCGEPECPQGSENYRGQCVPTCPENHSRDENGRCVPPDGDCPPETERVNGQCMPPCEQGTSRAETGECEPVDQGCEPGLVRDKNGRCVPLDCPRGQVKFGGKCVPKCPPDQVRDNKGRCVCPNGTEQFQGRCVPECRQGLERNSKGRCVCPDGTDFVGGRCVAECEQGLVRDSNGRCVRPGCPAGTERFKGQCVPKCNAPFVRNNKGRCVCPAGTRYRQSTGSCEKVAIEQDCPDGFRMNEFGQCERIRRVPQGCPEGFYFSKKRQRCLPIQQDGGQQPLLEQQPRINQDSLRKLIIPEQQNPETFEQIE